MMSWFRKAKPSVDPASSDRKRRMLRLPHLPAAVYAIGDVHGRLDLYKLLEDEIVRDAAGIEGEKLIILLGDMIDRTSGGAGVIDHLLGPAPEGFVRQALRGNHEEMMLNFLDDPEANMAWVSWGGGDTLSSYGIHPETGQDYASMSPAKLGMALRASVPTEHVEFLQKLPYCIEIGRFRFAHACSDLAAPLEDQSPRDLLWGQPETQDAYGGDRVLVHGHVPVDEPDVRRNRVNVDTGAFKSGVLTAMRVLPGEEEWLFILT